MAIISGRTAKVASSEDSDATVITTTDKADRTAVVGKAQVDERLAARRRLEARTAAAERAAAARSTITPGNTEVITTAGPRARLSFVATLSLMLGLVAALTVLTGVLAGPGVAVGLIAALVGIGGMSATRRRHVAGTGGAMLGIALGLCAVVIGILALTGTLPWLNADTDYVTRVREWLDAQLPWLFPSS